MKKTDLIETFTKKDYVHVVRQKRQDFIHKHFSEELSVIFNNLRVESSKMKHCHFEVSFDIPEHFDISKIEHMIKEYFRDLGYKPIPEPRKEGIMTVTMTLA